MSYNDLILRLDNMAFEIIHVAQNFRLSLLHGFIQHRTYKILISCIWIIIGVLLNLLIL